MCKNQWITKYLVEFNQIAARVQWGDMPLHCQLYNGFPSQIKDEISRVGKSGSLADLHTLAQSIDARYCECQNETTRKMTVNKTQDKSKDKGKTPTTAANQNPSNKNPPNSGTPSNTTAPTVLVLHSMQHRTGTLIPASP